MKKVGLIAVRLGPARTRDELLPFLANTIDEDELQICLSEELKKFVHLVGGPAHAHTLIVRFFLMHNIAFAFFFLMEHFLNHSVLHSSCLVNLFSEM